jgi:hypothetical protein
MSKCPVTLANLFKNLSTEEAEGLVKALESMRENNPSSNLFDTYIKAKKKIEAHVAMHRLAIVQAKERSPRLYTAFQENLAKYNNPAVALEQLISYDVTRNHKDLDFTSVERRYAMELNGALERVIYKSQAHLNVYTNKTLKVNGVEKNLSLLVARQVWEHTKTGGALGEIADLADWGESAPFYTQAINDVATLIHDTNHRILTRLQESGLPVEALSEYYLPTQHDPDKLHGAIFEDWLDDFVPLLDLEKTFGDTVGGAVDERGLTKGQYKFFKKVFSSIAESNLSPTILSRIQDDAFQNFGEKLIRERTFHFKDADSWHIYHAKYGVGEGNPQIMLNRRIQSSSHQLAMMDVFGISPERTLFSLTDGVLGHLLKEKGISNTLDLKDITTPPPPPPIPESMRLESVVKDPRELAELLHGPESLIKLEAGDAVKKTQFPLSYVLSHVGFSADVLERLFNPLTLSLARRPSKGDYASLQKLVNSALKSTRAVSLSTLGDDLAEVSLDVFRDPRQNRYFAKTLNDMLDGGEAIVKSIDERHASYVSEKALYDQKHAEYQVALENSLRDRKSDHARAWSALVQGDEMLNKIGAGLQDNNGSITHAMQILKNAYSGREYGQAADNLAWVGANLRAAVQLGKLGSSVITNINDFTNMTYVAWTRGLTDNPLQTLFGTLDSAWNARTGKYDPVEMARHFIETMGRFGTGESGLGDRVGAVSTPELAELFDDFGVVVQNLNDALQGDLLDLTDSLVDGRISKSLQFMNETTGLERLNTTFKRAMGGLAISKIGKESGKAFEKLPRAFRQELSRFGINDVDWDLASEFITDVKGKPHFDLHRLYGLSSNKDVLSDNFSASVMAKLEKASALAGEPLERYVPNLKNKYGAFIADAIYTGSLTPNRFDRAYAVAPVVTDALGGISTGVRSYLYNGKAGDVTRELLASTIFQLKTFTMSYMNTMYRDFWDRSFQRGTQGDRARAVGIMAANFAVALGLGYLTNSARSIVSGYTPPVLVDEERRRLKRWGCMPLSS